VRSTPRNGSVPRSNNNFKSDDHHRPPACGHFYIKESFEVRETGHVKFYSDNKGWGFIKHDLGGKDVFVHCSAVALAGLSTLRENQRLSYECKDDDGRGRGPSAQNIVDLDI
jgi:CspA family cold shock protein